MAERRIINRTYICRLCGKMPRAPAYYVPGAPASPQCCGLAMRTLAYEATVVANRMSEAERVGWLRSGGRFVKAGGGVAGNAPGGQTANPRCSGPGPPQRFPVQFGLILGGPGR